jgi:hypothetical protein
MIRVKGLLLLGASLLMAAGVAAAGPVKHGPEITGKETDCANAAAWMDKIIGGAGVDLGFVEPEQDNVTGPEDSMIEEYLSFHAQASEEDGKLSLMPWSALRSHSD